MPWVPSGDLGWRVPHGVKGSKMGGNIVITGKRAAWSSAGPAAAVLLTPLDPSDPPPLLA